ncbi:MAG TPA: alpha/beta fold hydrolase [Thermoanaerobaculia bacterium]|nr:alpha/beta fold hydrolase [Thermoanaerobaculia bacterium]
MIRRRSVGHDRVAGLALAVAATGALAELNLRRDRRRRLALGDCLYVENRGRGAPVVFLPGLQGSTRYWRRAFDDLAAGRRLLFVDLLGFGRSPWPAAGYTLDDQLAALRRTLVAVGATRQVTLVGHSTGAVLAAYYAARHPAEVSRLVLLGTPVFDNPREARRRLWKLGPLAGIFSQSRPLAWAACTLLCALRPLLVRTLPGLGRELPAAVVRDATLHVWPAVDGTIRHLLLGSPISAALAQLAAHGGLGGPGSAGAPGAPDGMAHGPWPPAPDPGIVFVHGVADPITPLARIRRLAAATGAAVAAAPGGHLSYVTVAREITRAAILGSHPG